MSLAEDTEEAQLTKELPEEVGGRQGLMSAISSLPCKVALQSGENDKSDPKLPALVMEAFTVWHTSCIYPL